MCDVNQEFLNSILCYDKDTGIVTWKQSRGSRAKKGSVVGSNHSAGYLTVGISKKNMFLHRVIWMMVYGYFPVQIDHIDGNRRNNKLSNLRECCGAENCQNVARSKNNTSGYTGVHFHSATGKYRAQITKNRKKHSLGLFNTAEDASEAYRTAKRNMHTFNPSVRE